MAAVAGIDVGIEVQVPASVVRTADWQDASHSVGGQTLIPWKMVCDAAATEVMGMGVG